MQRLVLIAGGEANVRSEHTRKGLLMKLECTSDRPRSLLPRLPSLFGQSLADADLAQNPSASPASRTVTASD